MIEHKNNSSATGHRIFALGSIPANNETPVSLWSLLAPADQAELAQRLSVTVTLRSPVTDLRRRHSATAAAYVKVTADQAEPISLRGTAEKVLGLIYVTSATVAPVTTATVEIYTEVQQ